MEDRKTPQELLEEYRKSDFKDVIDTSVKAGASLIPGFSQFFNDFVKSPSQIRLHKFLEAVVVKLNELESTNRETDLNQDSFQTVLMHSLQVASRNHQEEKIEVLRNAVLNSALVKHIDEDKQLIFVRYIDELTPTHIQVLDIIQNLSQYAKEKIIPFIQDSYQNRYRASEVECQLPIIGRLNEEPLFYNQIIRDLENRGLVDFDDFREKKTDPFLRTKTQRLQRNYSRLNSFGKFDYSSLDNVFKDLVDIVEDVSKSSENISLGSLNYVQVIRSLIYGKSATGAFYLNGSIEVYEKKTTRLGDSFINFLSSPILE